MLSNGVLLKGQPNVIFTKVDMEMLSVGMEMCSLESQAALYYGRPEYTAVSLVCI